MKTWDYMLKTTHRALSEAELNDLGSLGWELCATERRLAWNYDTGGKTTITDYTFKREKPPKRYDPRCTASGPMRA